MTHVLMIALFACTSAMLLTWWVRRVTIAQGIIDHPTLRSSHSVPTPRGGGLAIVAASTIGIAYAYSAGVVDGRLTLALLCGLAVAWIGFMDDRQAVSVRTRFVVHCVAAAAAVYLLGGVPRLSVGGTEFDLGLAGHALAVVAIIWVLNLFNFMDGIDGIAASEAVFVTLNGAVIGFVSGTSSAASAALIVGAAALGFLAWNWPPAKIFMGDVASGYLGYAIAILALASSRMDSSTLFVWLILGGVFFVDATVTLIRRLCRGERVYEAHRMHAYQWLSRRWRSHQRVTLAVCTLNFLWLLPLAWLCTRLPAQGVWIATLALAPLVVLSLAAGAGRAESASSGS